MKELFLWFDHEEGTPCGYIGTEEFKIGGEDYLISYPKYCAERFGFGRILNLTGEIERIRGIRFVHRDHISHYVNKHLDEIKYIYHERFNKLEKKFKFTEIMVEFSSEYSVLDFFCRGSEIGGLISKIPISYSSSYTGYYIESEVYDYLNNRKKELIKCLDYHSKNLKEKEDLCLARKKMKAVRQWLKNPQRSQNASLLRKKGSKPAMISHSLCLGL